MSVVQHFPFTLRSWRILWQVFVTKDNMEIVVFYPYQLLSVFSVSAAVSPGKMLLDSIRSDSLHQAEWLNDSLIFIFMSTVASESAFSKTDKLTEPCYVRVAEVT